jgi:transposase
MKITTIGIDLAKHVFQVHGVDASGKTVLRKQLLIHGARAVIRHAERRLDAQGWLAKLIGRRNKNVAAVALANKNARTVWALLVHDRQFQSD